MILGLKVAELGGTGPSGDQGTVVVEPPLELPRERQASLLPPWLTCGLAGFPPLAFLTFEEGTCRGIRQSRPPPCAPDQEGLLLFWPERER